jgi:hypothetical protein
MYGRTSYVEVFGLHGLTTVAESQVSTIVGRLGIAAQSRNNLMVWESRNW